MPLGGVSRSRWREAVLCAAVCWLLPAAALAQACAGDCDGDQLVEVDELIAGVSAALGTEAPRPCRHFDANDDGAVGVDELTRAVGLALSGCPDATTARGTCARPGPSGLQPCAAPTNVRAAQCSNPRFCVEDDPDAAALLASGAVDSTGTLGTFALVLDRRRVGIAPVVFAAEVEAGTRYASIFVASGVAAILAGDAPEGLRLDPMSEATTRLIDECGLENFDADGIALIEQSVREANAGETFAGLTAAAAADRATAVARLDPAVGAAIEQSIVPADVTLHVASASGPPGDAAEISVSLTDGGRAVVAAENLVSYDPSTPIAVKPDGDPDCAVDPGIRKDETVFSFQPAGCTPGLDCAGLKAFVVSFDDVRPIADGAVLYTCRLEVSAELLAGDVLPLACSSARYSGADGPIPAPSASCTGGQVAVTAP